MEYINNMRNEITTKNVNGLRIVKLRGGRDEQVIKDKSRYNRKTKHKGQRQW